MTNNTWHSVSSGRNGTFHSLYLDGVNVGSRTQEATDYSGRQFVLGSKSSQCGSFKPSTGQHRRVQCIKHSQVHNRVYSGDICVVLPISTHRSCCILTVQTVPLHLQTYGLLTVVTVTGGTGINVLPVTGVENDWCSWAACHDR